MNKATFTPEETNIIKAEIFERVLANTYLEKSLDKKSLAELQAACDCNTVGRFTSIPQDIFMDVVLRLREERFIFFYDSEDSKEITLDPQHIPYAVRCWENQYLKKN